MMDAESSSKADLSNACRKGASITLASCNALVAAGAIFTVTFIGPMMFDTWISVRVQLPAMSELVRDWYVQASAVVAIGFLMGGVAALFAGHRRGVVFLNSLFFFISVLWFGLVACALSLPFVSIIG